MTPYLEMMCAHTRRHFLERCSLGLAGIFLGSQKAAGEGENPLALKKPHFEPRAKAVIYLHMAGSPSQLDLFDWKPELVKYNDKDCPQHLLEGKRFAFIKGVPKMMGTPYKFAQHGRSGAWVSELLPHFSTVVDDVAIVRSMTTEQFNHAPAQLFLHTGNPRFGFASMGAWATYGLGSENQDLPGFVVLVGGGNNPDGGKSLWGSGFLPSVYQGVQCRTSGDPVLFLSDPEGMTRSLRRQTLDAMRDLNQIQQQRFGDPETSARIAQYELAYRMQISVPEVMDISKEPEAMHKLYGTQPGKVSFANNCLLARRLVEKGVRFVQLFQWGWDHHGSNRREDIRYDLPEKAKNVDQPVAALIQDLKQRGLLDSTLVVWGGEFGRTPMRENRGGTYGQFVGRDHHPHAFTIWMAGGGVKAGLNYGETDDIGYYVSRDPVTVRDLQAAILHLLGLDAHKLSYPFQGLNQRLIGPADEGKVLKDLLA
ncbi:MAG: DUF1501 domain-containing protein [Acidobacteria bacterium]|nr:DUF1501 domain-containing protein [Acidobacteriota bacterium]MCI0718855.1 DUF1501 domain-containing protein [Acidobacteriota bacterium]